MVVDVPHRTAVGLGLRLGDGVVHPSGVDLHLIGEGQAVNDFSDMPGGGVVVMVVVLLAMPVAVVMVMVVMVMVMVVMVMLVVVMVVVVLLLAVEVVMMGLFRWGGGLSLLLAVHGDGHVGARDAAGGGGLSLQMHPGQPQTVHGIQKALLVLQQLVQGGHEHIPGGPHIALNVERFHINVPPVLPFD